jgi:hypothetical protein
MSIHQAQLKPAVREQQPATIRIEIGMDKALFLPRTFIPGYLVLDE